MESRDEKYELQMRIYEGDHDWDSEDTANTLAVARRKAIRLTIKNPGCEVMLQPPADSAECDAFEYYYQGKRIL